MSRSFRVIPHVQGTPAWLSWRNGGLGGSDAGAIWASHVGQPELFPYATAEDIYLEKTVGAPREQSFAMRRGNRLEPVARQLFTEATGLPVEPLCIEHQDRSWLKASLDGWHDPDCLLEIKAPNILDHDWALAGIVPPKYRAQLMHQAIVSGADRVLYASYSEHRSVPADKRLAIVTFEPTAEMLGELLEAEEVFWARVSKWWEAQAA